MGLAQQGGIIVSRMQLSTSPLLPSTPSSRPRPRLRGHSRIKELGVSPRKGNVIAGSLQHPAVQSASAPRGPWHRGPHVLLRPAAPPFAGPGGRGGQLCLRFCSAVLPSSQPAVWGRSRRQTGRSLAPPASSHPKLWRGFRRQKTDLSAWEMGAVGAARSLRDVSVGLRVLLVYTRNPGLISSRLQNHENNFRAVNLG